MLMKADPTTKNMDANGVWLEQIASVVYIKVIFTLLVGLQVRDDWLQSRGTSLCRTLSLFLDELGGGYGEDWTSCIAGG